MTTPLLIISDAPTAPTGLGRIVRDLATRIHANLADVFEVATVGYGGPYSRKLGFQQYGMDMANFVIFNLPDIWYDFAGDKQGIVMTVWDASRLLWFSRPENCENDALRKFLTKPPFKRWGYFPTDATGPNDKMTTMPAHVIEGFDRVLAYSKWAERILLRSCPTLENVTNLPHGLDTSVFYPRNRAAARHGLGERIGSKNDKGKWIAVPDDALMIGIVATNQSRKDWGLGIETVAEIAQERKVFLWAHTDALYRAWDIHALLTDFGLRNASENFITLAKFPDEVMAWLYSACDVTLGIGNGEGFGFPIFESLACGTPCVHGDYGGAPEHMKEGPLMLVQPKGQRYDGPFNSLRYVYTANEWAYAVEALRGTRVSLPASLDWNNLWPRWEAWLRAGVQ